MRTLAWLTLVLLSTGGCGAAASNETGNRPHVGPGNTPGAGTALPFANRIDDALIWHSLAARPEDETFARTEVVKFLVDLEDGDKPYFVQTDRWPIHYDFAREMLHTPEHPIEDHYSFNVREYRRPDRRFFLGSLVHYLDGDVWAVELIAGDTAGAALFRRGFAVLQGATFFGADLRFHPTGPRHDALLTELANSVPVVQTDELLSRVSYQPLTLGTAVGTLHLVRGELDFGALSPGDIVVTRDVPDDLPVCAALVTSELQAPLAHVAVLSQNRGSPNMALRGAVDDARWSELDGHLVKLVVGAQDFRIEAISAEDARAFVDSRRPSQTLVPTLDVQSTALMDVCALRNENIAFAGAKASQLGEVCGLDLVRTPEGFVVPMSYYAAQLTRAGATPMLEQLLRDPAVAADRRLRGEKLAGLRTRIERTAPDAALVAAVRRRLGAFAGARKVIFRSSTNAEDLPGFNGAGLYESIVVSLPATDASIADALARVWSSVFTLRGFDERDYYHIDHRRVAMAVLIQPFVDDVVARGVAITANPFYEARPAVFINVQSREGSVTAAGDDVPEQHLVYTYSEELEDEVLSRSSLTHGTPVLETPDVLALTRILQGLHNSFVPSYGDRANAVDVEFVVTAQREVVVVQARPYRVVYSAGRRDAFISP